MAILKTNIEALAAILAVAANAENDYNANEQASVAQMAPVLEMPSLPEQVEKALEKVNRLEGEQLGQFLMEAAKAVVEGEEAYVMEAVMQVILADKTFAYTESSNLLVIANALGLSHDVVMLMLADAMKEDSGINVIFSEII